MFCIFLQKIFVIEDCFFYGDMQKVINDFNATDFVSGRTIYYLRTAYNTDVELEFKFKDNVPTSFLVGFGEVNIPTSAYGKTMFYNNNNNLVLFADNSSVNISNPSKTKDTIFKLTTSQLHNISAYIDDSLKTTRSTNTSYNLNLRIDSFTATPTVLEYLKVKAL